jgi:hypothetical protein
VESAPRAYKLKAGNAAPPISTMTGTSLDALSGLYISTSPSAPAVGRDALTLGKVPIVTTIVHNPNANDRVEYFGQIVNAFVDTTVEFPVLH